MIHANLLRRGTGNVPVQKLAAKFGVQIMRKVIADEVLAADGEAVLSVDLAEGIVNGGIKRACGDEHAKFWNGKREMQVLGNADCGFHVFRLQRLIDIERMREL